MNFDLHSDQNGTVHGTYEDALCNPVSVRVKKQGFESYSTGIRTRYVVRRQFKPRELLGVIQLHGDRQRMSFENFSLEISPSSGKTFKSWCFTTKIGFDQFCGFYPATPKSRKERANFWP